MTTNQVPSRRKIANRIIKTLGAFGALAVVWVVLHLTASVANPFGVVSLLAGIAFLSMMVALLANLVVASSLLWRREPASK